MTFAEHIKNNIFSPRLADKRILVVYDAQNRFRAICTELESEQCAVIFTEKRLISSRQDAMERWQAMAADTTYQSQMLIHCVESPPKDNDARQQHPFASYAAVGTSFPSRASDEYRQLCYGFLKDRTVEIDQLFASGEEPAFALIDNLSGGTHSHPQLQALFGTADASKIIPDFLAPTSSSSITANLEANTNWCEEMRQLLQRTLGLKLNVQSTKAATIRKKLWQYLLFSEFANDLPCQLPGALQDIPKASGAQLHFAISLCVDLRQHAAKKEVYRDEANAIEQALNLESECHEFVDLGQTDTFAFEEKNFLRRASVAIRASQWDAARDILDAHKTSLWTEEGERRLLWRILELGLETLENIKRSEIQLLHIGSSGQELCALYDSELIKVDRAYRELEEATAQTLEGYEEIEAIVEATRKSYRAHFNLLQSKFLPVVQREGWPLNEMKANVASYDEHVAPALRDGKRVVYFLIDALRLDLAQDLESNIHDHQVRRIPACAQLPCVTKFGMASLLPEANAKLRFETNAADEILPSYAGKDVGTRKARMEIFDATLNDRVSTSNLSDFIGATKTKRARETFIKKTADTDLLVLTSVELDSLGEGTHTSNLQHIPAVMRELQMAIARCAELGYDTAVIGTDHGFVWIEDADNGSLCDTPPGQWPLKKRRCYLGTGEETTGTIRFTSKELSIPTAAPSFIVPKALATFSKGNGYFHEGLSLQESLVPRLVIQFAKISARTSDSKNPEIELSYKKKTVYQRIFSINISWPGTPDMFSEGSEFKLVALQNNQEIGYPTSGDHVDPSSGFVKMKQGESIKMNLRLNDDSEDGPIHIKAIHPETDLTIDSLALNFHPTVF